MSSVLVTGASGFIGLHLVEALMRREANVRCLVRTTSKTGALLKLGVEIATADFADSTALARAVSGIDVVYHVAGVTRALSQSDFDRFNGEATGRLAEVCAAQPQPPRLVLVSSVAASGPAPRGQVRTEADPPVPVSYYGRSKLAGEQAAERFAAKLPLAIVRPGIVFGPRDLACLKFLKSIRTLGIHLSPGFFPPALSWIHVTDLIELLLRVADRGSAVPPDQNGRRGQGRYFAVAPEYPTYADAGRIVRPMLARSFAPVLPVAAPVAWCVAGVNECISRIAGRPDELCFDKLREALATSWACSGQVAERDLDFRPAKSLVERWRETVDWYFAEGWL